MSYLDKTFCVKREILRECNVYREYVVNRRLRDYTEEYRVKISEDSLSPLDGLIYGLNIRIKFIEELHPDYRDRYDAEYAMFNSFTQAQKDFICYQIGEWYMLWKDNMWTGDIPNQHWLGRGKEELKTMICGE